MKKALATLLLFVISLSAHGKMITTEYSYKLDTTTFKGFLAYDDAVTGKTARSAGGARMVGT